MKQWSYTLKKTAAIFTTVALAAALLTGCTTVSVRPPASPSPSTSPASSLPPEETTPALPASDPLVADAATFESFGHVVYARLEGDSVYIIAEGLMGYHMDENPSISVGVTISSDGTILDAEVVEMKAQTPGFGEMVDNVYLARVYSGQAATSTMDAEPVTGATISSRAALYAVRTAAHYAAAVYGFEAETSAADIAELNAVYPAAYTAISTDTAADLSGIGAILFAAEGAGEDGSNLVALKVRGEGEVDPAGANFSGFASSIPGPYTMIIVIDRDTSRVAAWQVVTDGTSQRKYFVVPDETVDAYGSVEITDGSVFDAFTGGLVLSMDVPIEDDMHGVAITGTSIAYTGATVNGTFSSQMVRFCFRAAARFYAAL